MLAYAASRDGERRVTKKANAKTPMLIWMCAFVACAARAVTPAQARWNYGEAYASAPYNGDSTKIAISGDHSYNSYHIWGIPFRSFMTKDGTYCDAGGHRIPPNSNMYLISYGVWELSCHAVIDCVGSWTPQTEAAGQCDCDPASANFGKWQQKYGVTRNAGAYGTGCEASNNQIRYESCSESSCPVTVTIGRAAETVVAYSTNFGINVGHFSCNSPASQIDCFRDVTSSASLDSMHNVRCAVTVKNDKYTCDAGYDDHFPCRQWDNFIPSALPMTTSSGRFADEGSYTITYDCHVVDTSGIKISGTSVAGTHTFDLKHACGNIQTMDVVSGDRSNVARYIMLGADEFNNVDSNDANACTASTIYRIKEAIFRKFDVISVDGVLDYEELVQGAIRQSMDTYALQQWNDLSGGNLQVTVSQFMRASIQPLACGQVSSTSSSSNIMLRPDITYATSTTSASTCANNAGKLSATWVLARGDGKTTLTLGDYACVYIDGVLNNQVQSVSSSPSSNSLTYTKFFSGTSNKEVWFPTGMIDVRPVSGPIRDIKPSLVAHFTFDNNLDDSGSIVSVAPLVVADQKLTGNAAVAGNERVLSACTGSDGEKCVPATGNVNAGSYDYIGSGFTADMAMSVWAYSSTCTGQQTIARFSSHASAVTYAQTLELYFLDNVLTIKFTASDGTISQLEMPSCTCNAWHMVGFTYSQLTGMSLFINPTSNGESLGTAVVTDPTWASGMMMLTALTTVRQFFVGIAWEYDDLRIYSGQVDMATFIDSYDCGHRTVCTARAHATPSSRRVVCVSAYVNGVSATSSEDFQKLDLFSCGGGLFYDGAPTDVVARQSLLGVHFAFRDTSWDEVAFELVRRRADIDFATVKYETVLIIPGSLLRCASKFNSMSYIDSEASESPGNLYYYAVRTKSASGDFISAAHEFLTPFYTEITGKVSVGSSTVGVRNVRICADFDETRALSTTPQNVAYGMHAIHSTSDSDAALSVHFVTDNDANTDKFVTNVDKNEFVRIDLANWYSIATIKVCFHVAAEGAVRNVLNLPNAKLPKAFVEDYDTLDSSFYGKSCSVDTGSGTKPVDMSTCYDYACQADSLTSFRGRYITIVSQSDSFKLTEVYAIGHKELCTFTAVTDDNGLYEFAVEDSSGTTVTSRDLNIGAYKEELFEDASGVSSVVHTFGSGDFVNSKNGMENYVLKVFHMQSISQAFTDDTAFIVSGRVVFPSSHTPSPGTGGCGLQSAMVTVTNTVNGESEEYETNSTGHFQGTLSIGGSYKVSAAYTYTDSTGSSISASHTICYAGADEDVAFTTDSCGTSDVDFVTLSNVQHDQSVYFVDVTKGNVELATFHGDCDAVYGFSTFKIQPVNACHGAITVTQANVDSWSRYNTQLASPPSIFVKTWPYAALEYTITLVESDNNDEGVRVDDTGASMDGCAIGTTGTRYSYFEDQGTRDRTLDMRFAAVDQVQSIRYKYHGYICVEILAKRESNSAFDSLPAITGPRDVCYNDKNVVDGDLQMDFHFLGTTDAANVTVPSSKDIQVRVFEYHVDAGGNLKKCHVMPGTNANGDALGSTSIQFRENVGDESTTPCHFNRGGDESCDFDIHDHVDSTSGVITFPDGASRSATKSIAASSPNIVSPYRRQVQATVIRNDGYKSVSSAVQRPLIPLGSRVRGGSGDSDNVYWATVPIAGLVYTVVHDPPGGNSYAELLEGTEISMHYENANERAASIASSYKYGGGAGFEARADTEACVGVGALFCVKSADVPIFKMGFDAAHAESGPAFSTSQSDATGWDLTATMSRVIRTSMDISTPGRAGDVILGGGIEITYMMSDIVDIKDGTTCVYDYQEVTWLPRHPTSYVFGVHAIESQVIPNLRYLISVVDGGVVNDIGEAFGAVKTAAVWRSYLEGAIDDWKRTLLWSSPVVSADSTVVAADGTVSGPKTGNIDRISTPFLSANSVFGKQVEAGNADLLAQTNERIGPLTSALADAWVSMYGVQPYIDGDKMSETSGQDAVGKLKGYIESTKQTKSSDDYWGVTNDSGYVWKPRAWFGDTSGTAWSTRDDDNKWSGYAFLSLFTDQDSKRSTMGMNVDARNDTIVPYDPDSSSTATLRPSSSATTQMIPETVDSASAPTMSLEDTSRAGSAATRRVQASFTGGKGPTGMINSANEGVILLSFSGGGESTEYIFTSNENVDGQDYGFEMKLEGTAENSYEYTGSIYWVNAHGEEGASMEKSVSASRMFGWAKYERTSTLYALGDPDMGDKFAVRVQSDSRFGTPVFLTKGGRSKCPGELSTMFRESDISLNFVSGLQTMLNPDEAAFFQLYIENASPYREPANVGLRLVDIVYESVKALIAAAFDAAENGGTKDDVKNAVDTAFSASHGKKSDELIAMQTAAHAVDAGGDGFDVAHAVVAAAKAYAGTNELASSMIDMKFTINGITVWPFGEVLPLKHITGQRQLKYDQTIARRTVFALSAARSRLMFDTKFIGLEVVSLCESMIETSLYRSILSHSVSLGDMTWSKPCPRVAFDKSTMNAAASGGVTFSESAGKTTFTVIAINPSSDMLWPFTSTADAATANTKPSVNTNLQYVRLQYRSTSGGEWITVKDEAAPSSDAYKQNLLCDLSRGSGCAFEWNAAAKYDNLLSGAKDGTYEVRVKNFCSGGDVLAAPLVHEYTSDQLIPLRIDNSAPSNEDAVLFKFLEEINCSRITTAIMRTAWCNGKTSTKVYRADQIGLEFSCTNVRGKGYISTTYPASTRGTFSVTISGVTDLAGNAADEQTASFMTSGCIANTASAPATASLGAYAGHASAISKVPFVATFVAGVISTLTVVMIFTRSRTRRNEQSVASLIDARSIKPTYGAVV